MSCDQSRTPAGACIPHLCAQVAVLVAVLAFVVAVIALTDVPEIIVAVTGMALTAATRLVRCH